MEGDRKSFIEAIRQNTMSLATGLRTGEAPVVGLTGRQPKFRKLEETDDVEHYLLAFERFASTYRLSHESLGSAVSSIAYR